MVLPPGMAFPTRVAVQGGPRVLARGGGRDEIRAPPARASGGDAADADVAAERGEAEDGEVRVEVAHGEPGQGRDK